MKTLSFVMGFYLERCFVAVVISTVGVFRIDGVIASIVIFSSIVLVDADGFV